MKKAELLKNCPLFLTDLNRKKHKIKNLNFVKKKSNIFLYTTVLFFTVHCFSMYKKTLHWTI